MLLDLYDTYYLPLQSGLRPVMKSFILALLPGLEEETGEFFDKVSIINTRNLWSYTQNKTRYYNSLTASQGLCRLLSSSKTSGLQC